MQSHYEQIFNSFNSSCLGHDYDWLQVLRHNQLKLFLQKGFPKRADEAWKYTSLTSLEKIPFHIADNQMDREVSISSIFDADIAGRIVFIDGFFAPSFSYLRELLPLASFYNFGQYIDNESDFFRNYVTRSAEKNSNSLQAMNLAFLQDGFVLSITKESVIKKPIHVMYVSTGRDHPTLSCLKNHITIEEGAHATIFEEHVSLSDMPYLQNINMQIDVKAGGILGFYQAQRLSSQHYYYTNIQINQEKDSTVKTWHVACGGKIARDDLNVILAGQGASCEIRGIYLPNHEQHIDFHTSVQHAVPNTTSLQEYHGILAGQASAVFNGKVVVEPQACRINATQTNHNLLLSKKAEVNTKPELEIYADDVKCAHGATVGQLDETALFYLRSRGINKSTAAQLLLQGFAYKILESITNEDIRNSMESLINYKMKDFIMEG